MGTETNSKSLRAGFAEVNITPPIGTAKIGVLKHLVSESVHDPLFARVAILENPAERVAFVQLDTLSVRWSQVAEIRRRVTEDYGFPGANVLVAATHNHAGPAVSNTGAVARDDAYVETMIAKVVAAFGEALANRQKAEIGFGRCPEFRVSHDRRIVRRDGTVSTHGNFLDENALFVEGPIDPELAVLGVRSRTGELLGTLVNFACHVGHHGSSTALSAGFPGVLDREMKARGCPMTLFLNGACGNIAYGEPGTGAIKDEEDIGTILAADVNGILDGMAYTPLAALAARSQTIKLPYRECTEDEIQGTAFGAQRSVPLAPVYEHCLPTLLQRIRERGTQPADVQVLEVGECTFVAIPAEYFAESVLRRIWTSAQGAIMAATCTSCFVCQRHGWLCTDA